MVTNLSNYLNFIYNIDTTMQIDYGGGPIGGYSANIREKSIAIPDINIYPQPANAYIAIDNHENELMGKLIYIFDILGRKLITEKADDNLQNNEININVSCLRNGVYILHCGNYTDSCVDYITNNYHANASFTYCTEG